jgi:hypothetical protein
VLVSGLASEAPVTSQCLRNSNFNVIREYP